MSEEERLERWARGEIWLPDDGDALIDAMLQLRAENARLRAVADAARKMREHFSKFHGARLTVVDVLAITAVNTALAALDAEPEKKEG